MAINRFVDNPAAHGAPLGRAEYERRLDASGASGVVEILDPRTALPVAPSADPTRLDPPIAVEVNVPLWDAAEDAAVAHLHRLHGWVNGSANLADAGTPEHIEATSTLLRAHRVRLLLTHIDATGRPTFALAPPEKA